VFLFSYTIISTYKHYLWHLTVCYIVSQRLAVDNRLGGVKIKERDIKYRQQFYLVGKKCPEARSYRTGRFQLLLSHSSPNIRCITWYDTASKNIRTCFLETFVIASNHKENSFTRVSYFPRQLSMYVYMHVRWGSTAYENVMYLNSETNYGSSFKMQLNLVGVKAVEWSHEAVTFLLGGRELR
jgi:hypothetical protein